MRIAVLGPGGVGGLIAGALDRAGRSVSVIARASTAELINTSGLSITSVRLGDFSAHPPASQTLTEPVDALIVATKAGGLQAALERVATEPTVVLPLLNGLDHLTLLRRRFSSGVLAAAIRVEADRPRPGVVVQTSPFLRIDMACSEAQVADPMAALAGVLSDAGIPARVMDSEPAVIWGKLVRLNALACTTSAYDKLLGEIRGEERAHRDLIGAIEEGCAVADAEGAHIDPSQPTMELEEAHATLGSSMQRDIAAGREPELDAIPGALLRAGARHGIPCPTTQRLFDLIAARAGMKPARTGAEPTREG